MVKTTDAPAAVPAPQGLDLLEHWLAHRETCIAEDGERCCDPDIVAPGSTDVALCRRLHSHRTARDAS